MTLNDLYRPIAVKSYFKIVNAFTWNVWLSFYASSIVFSAVFFIITEVYSHVFEMTLVKVKWDLILKPFAGFAEPDVIPWFTGEQPGGVRAGKIAMISFSIFSTFFMAFFQSNLRSILISPTFEKPIDSVRDVIDRGAPFWTAQQLHYFAPKNVKVRDGHGIGGQGGAMGVSHLRFELNPYCIIKIMKAHKYFKMMENIIRIVNVAKITKFL